MERQDEPERRDAAALRSRLVDAGKTAGLIGSGIVLFAVLARGLSPSRTIADRTVSGSERPRATASGPPAPAVTEPPTAASATASAGLPRAPGYPAAGRPLPPAAGAFAGDVPFSQRRPSPENRFRLRGVHFFQDDWPYTFWDNLDVATLDAEFGEIRTWGFNTVVLFLSWGSFQRTHRPPRYDESAFAKLRALVEAARRQGLWVVARVGTPEQVPEDLPGGSFAIRDLMYEQAQLTARADLFAEVSRRLADLDNVFGLYTSWEDFSDYLRVIHAPEAERREMAGRHPQFRADLARRGPIEHWNALWGTAYTSFDDIPIPSSGSRALVDYIDFVRDYIQGQILPGLRVGSGIALGFEARLDEEPVTIEGRPAWHGYRGGRLPDNVQFLASYYNPFWGTRNDGGYLSPELAAAHCARLHDALQADDPHRPIFVDQLNLADDTPAVTRTNTKLRYPHDEARAAERIVPDLFDRTIGYSLWTYKDYVGNLVRDGVFRSDRGLWQTSGGIEPVAAVGGRPGVAIGPGGWFRQDLAVHLDPGQGSDVAQRFDIRARVAGPDDARQRLTVVVRGQNGTEARRSLAIGGGEARLYGAVLSELRAERPQALALEADPGNRWPIEVSRPRLWRHLMASGVVDLDGIPRRSRAQVYQRLHREWERYEAGQAVPARHPSLQIGKALVGGSGVFSDGWARPLAVVPMYLPFATGAIALEAFVPEASGVGDRSLRAHWYGESPDRVQELVLRPGRNRFSIEPPEGLAPGDRVLLLKTEAALRLPGDDRELAFQLVRCGREYPRLQTGAPLVGRFVHPIVDPSANRLIVTGTWQGDGSARVTFAIRGHRPVTEVLDAADGGWSVVLPLWEEDLRGRPELFVEVQPLSGSGAPVVEAIGGEPERSPNLIYQ